MSTATPAGTTVRTFVDLRAFADDPRAGNRLVAHGDAFLASRRVMALPEGPVSLAALDLQGAGRVPSLPADEFILVLSGTLEIGAGTTRLALAANDSAVVPGGTGFDWRADPRTRAIVMRCASGGASAVSPVKIDHDAPLSPSGAPLAELLVGPAPSCRNHTAYESASGEFSCGTWDSTPYHRRAMDYRHYELMHLLEGAVTLVDGAGRSRTFGAGDILLAEQHVHGSWESKVAVKKVYAIYRPA